MMKQKSYFVLPPIVETYFINSNHWYQSLPPFLDDCLQSQQNLSEQIELINPTNLSRVLIPIELSFKHEPGSYTLNIMDEKG